MSGRLPDRSLLDVGDVPVGQIARAAYREGVRPRAVYQAHKWFARRLAITARSLLVAAATPAGSRFWKSYYDAPDLSGLAVLDPFLGGGVMALEASRLGADVFGVDVEPVATVISSFQGRLRDLPALDGDLETIASSVERRMGALYRSRDEDGKEETLLHAFRVQVVECASCGHRFHAHPTFKLASDPKNRRQWVACRSCSRIVETAIKRKIARCECGTSTRAGDGHVSNGTSICPACGHRERLIDLAKRSGPPRFDLFAVETIPSGPERLWSGKDRRIRSATAFDREREQDAAVMLSDLLRRDPEALPVVAIPTKGRMDDRLLRYGYRNYSDIFAPRQSLHLALLASEIDRLSGPVKEAFAVAFSDHLLTNNMLCSYAADWRRLSPLFSIRAFRHIARPVEINPWLRKNGRGTFPNAVRAVTRAAASLRAPVEPTPIGGWKQVADAAQGRWDIRTGDARKLAHLASASVDLVLTDPPYFDYISYSELGHFFVPWLAHFGLVPPEYLAELPIDQLAVDPRSADAVRRFTHGMAESFKEIRRVCRPGARVVFTYQNLDDRGWDSLRNAMGESGIVPFRTFPLFGDSSTSLHKHENSISWDAVLVCRLDEPGALALTEAHRARGHAAAQDWGRRLERQGFVLTSGDLVNIGQAESLVAAALQGRSSEARGPKVITSKALRHVV